MTESLAWAAGLFEGEGTITICGKRQRLAVKMTDRDAVDRFCLAVGLGKVYGPYGPYASQMGKLPTFYWCAEAANAVAVAQLLSPWLGERCKQRLQEVRIT